MSPGTDKSRSWIGLTGIATLLVLALVTANFALRGDAQRKSAAVRQAAHPTGAADVGSTSRQVDPASPSEVSVNSDGTSVTPLATPHQSLAPRISAVGLDPDDAGWQTEVIAERAEAQLKRLAQLLEPGERDKSTALADMLASDFRCGTLRPLQLDEVFADGAVQVRRAQSSAADRPALPSRRGATGLAAAVKELATPLANAANIDVHVKIVDVQTADDFTGDVQTTSHFDSSSNTPAGIVAQRATWLATWHWTPTEKLLVLKSLEARDYQETIAPQRWLSDCSVAALGHNDSFQEQLAYGLNHWLTRIGRVHIMSIVSRYGLAIGDVNGDGLEDVYVCQPAGLPNRLYVQEPNGTATDRSHAAGVDWLDHTSSALAIDLDNDGDQDLVAATVTGILLMENDSTGRFQRRAMLPPRSADCQSISAADYDQDGDLDLYICVDFAATKQTIASSPIQYHDANDGGTNLLLRNDIDVVNRGDWKFTDVTVDSGLDAQNRRHSLAASWEDYDNDGDPDLYVANDYGQNCLYRNDRGHFENVADEADVVDYGSGMSVSWGDYNRDGWMDLYVGNMFSSAGSRITRQAQFKAGESEQLRAVYRRFAKGNTLFANSATGKFRDVGDEADVEMGRWAWSSIFADLNNDGWDDLLVANGYMTTEDTGDL